MANREDTMANREQAPRIDDMPRNWKNRPWRPGDMPDRPRQAKRRARPGAPFCLGPGGGYPPMALSSEIDTPGPMVEHSEMPFM